MNFRESGIKAILLFLQLNRKDFMEEISFGEQLKCKIIERFRVSDMVCRLGDSLEVAMG